MKKDLISLQNLCAEEIEEILMLTESLHTEKHIKPLEGKSIGLIFNLPSLRTKVSFEVGIYQLGGQSFYLDSEDFKMGQREPIKDVAKVLSRYLNAIVIRTFQHEIIAELAKESNIPIINALSNYEHPCQVLADLYTILRKKNRLEGLKLAWIGDGNNVCRSFIAISSKVKLNLYLAIPEGFDLDNDLLDAAKKEALKNKCELVLTRDPQKAVSEADIIYTDVWTSMGYEKEDIERKKIFKKYQVNKKLVSNAKKDCLIMHCLPAHRGEEITEEILEGENSCVFDQAENRLHLQKGVLTWLLRK